MQYNLGISNQSREYDPINAINQSQGSKDKQKRNAIYAGGLNINQMQNSIVTKSSKAQKNSMKVILDQFKKDTKIDDNLVDRRKHQEVLAEQAKAAQEEIGRLQSFKQYLKKAYGVDDSSGEQKDLELLEKSMDPDQKLTNEEMEQLQGMGPLTDYQKLALQYDAMEEIWQQRIEDAQQGIVSEGFSIESIKLGRLKTHPMADAQKEAMGIIEAAYKEINQMLLKQTKDHIDDEFEKNKETDDSKETKDSEGKDSTNTDNRNDTSGKNQSSSIISDQDKVINELLKLVTNKQMIEDDIKGIVLDEQK